MADPFPPGWTEAAKQWREERELEEQRNRPPPPQKAFGKKASTNGVEIINAAGIDMQPVEWLWPGRLAKGKLTILSGDSELGKSTLAASLAAIVSQDAVWPDGEPCEGGQVIIVSSEDGIRDTIVPRLVAAKANLANMNFLTSMIEDDGSRRTLNLVTDMQKLGKTITAMGRVKLVIFDPITAYLGAKIDSHQAVPVRAVLEPLQDAAERYGFAGLLIAHPQKAAQSNVLNVVSGSAAFVQIPRLSFLVIKEENSERTLLLPGKNNIGVKAKGLGYFIESAYVKDDQIQTSRIIWDSNPVTITANQALAKASGKTSAMQEAVDFLNQKLNGQGAYADDLNEEAKANGISEATLRRARQKLGLKPTKRGFGEQGRWWIDRD